MRAVASLDKGTSPLAKSCEKLAFREFCVRDLMLINWSEMCIHIATQKIHSESDSPSHTRTYQSARIHSETFPL